MEDAPVVEHEHVARRHRELEGHSREAHIAANLAYAPPRASSKLRLGRHTVTQESREEQPLPATAAVGGAGAGR